MPHVRVEVTTDPDPRDMEALSRGIQAFNRHAVPGFPDVSEELRFAVLARDAEARLLGGIRAVGFWGSMTIELLWLAEAARGTGLGTRLLDAAEDFAHGRGLKYARVQTTSFQARPFYEQRGYRVDGVLEDFPLGHTSYWLSKRL